MQSLRGHATPKAYLDDQFTFERPEGASRVLKSALVKLCTYYAAIEHLPAGGDRVVFAAVCLVSYNPRDAEGYIFGYKDMVESMGLGEDACPAAILGLLTPTERPYALDWRRRCRDRLAARRAIAAKPSPQPGEVIVLEEPLGFRDGRSFTRLRAVRLAGRRGVVFRSEAGGLYRIPNLKTFGYRIERRAETGRLPLT